MGKRKHNDTLKSKKIKTDSIAEQDFINYISVPSLKSIAAVNVVVKLWDQPHFKEVQKLVHESGFTICDFDDIDESFYQIEKKISDKLSLLPLPTLLKDNMLNIIKPIGLAIVKWICHFQDYYLYCVIMKGHIDSICWTMEGIIDKAKTLELLLDNSSSEFTYNRACEFCLEDHIFNLWEQMSKETQENSFYNEKIYETYNYHLVAYWTCSAKNELQKLLSMIKPSDRYNIYDCSHSIYKNMCALSVSVGNALAVKYFWHKLTDGEMINNIVKWISFAIKKRNRNSADYTDILFFLLSQLNDKEQQKEVFQKYSDVVLKSLFSDWPWQRFLLPTIQVMWGYLDSKVYIDLLSIVIYEIKEGRTIQKFFKELWCNSPVKFKRYFIQHINDIGVMDVLWRLFDIEDIETIKLILNDANVEEKKQFIFSTIGSFSLYKLFDEDKLNLLDILIVESLLSECEIKNFKEKIIQKCGDGLCRHWIRNDNWQAVQKFLDWGFNSQDEIDIFKTKIVNKIEESGSLGMLGGGNWSSFERFISWCFNSDEEINQFKIHISSYNTMESIIFCIIAVQYNFEFAKELLVWCFPSAKEIDLFKKKLMLSDKGIDIFKRFAKNGKVYDANCSYWELAEKLMEWYHPFEKEVKFNIKRYLRKEE